MTPRERVLKAIAHEETDIVPYKIEITREADEKLAKYYGGPEYREQIIDHYVTASPTFFQAIAPYPQPDGTRLDLCGSRWEALQIEHLIEPCLKEASLEKAVFPDLSDPVLYEPVVEATRIHPDKFTLGVFLMTLFERSWALRGMTGILTDMAAEPEFCELLYDRILEWDLHILNKLCDIPVDGIYFTDDLGCQKGLIMGPHYWRQYLKARLARLFDYAHVHGKYVLLHSCGDNSEIMGELIEIGVDIFNPLQPEPMDIFEVKRRYGDRVTFDGGISTQVTLPYGTPVDVRSETELCLRELGRGGGYIIGPNKPIMGDVPVENAVALIEGITNQAMKEH